MAPLHYTSPAARHPATEEPAAANWPELQPPEMVKIPATTFLMGTPKAPGTEGFRTADYPQHGVTVRGFYLGRFLVTAQEYCAFLNEQGNHAAFVETVSHVDWSTIRKVGTSYVPQPGAERSPAYPVAWVGATRYCEWLSKRLGRPIRLPTEAEWEAAARGSELREWPWGEAEPRISDWGPSDEMRQAAERGKAKGDTRASWLVKLMQESADPIPFYRVFGSRWECIVLDEGRPWEKAPVGSYALNATPAGVYDLLGYFAGQWCQDAYFDGGYERMGSDSRPAEEAEDPPRRVLRGMWRVPENPSLIPNPFRVFTLPIDKGPRDDDGRSWSRIGGHERFDGAMFRIAMDMVDHE